MTIVTKADHAKKLYDSVKGSDKIHLQDAMQVATDNAGGIRNVTISALKKIINDLKRKEKQSKEHKPLKEATGGVIRRRGGGIAKRGMGIAK